MLLLPHEDLENRRLIWQALSTLFLDAYPTAGSYESIVATALECGYTLPELEVILREEVAPVASRNFYNFLPTDNEQTTFDGRWLEDQILQGFGGGSAGRVVIRYLLVPPVLAYIRRDWEKVCRLMLAHEHAAA